MATLQVLLRLPGCIRGQAFAQLSAARFAVVRQDLSSTAYQAFNNSARQHAQTKRPSRPLPHPGSVTPGTIGPKPRSQSPAPALKGVQPVEYAQALLGANEELLLYKAPSHRSFTIFSLASGFALLLGAYTIATNSAFVTDYREDTKQDKTKNRLGRWAAMGCGFVVACFATALILAPAAVITSICLRAVPSTQGAARRDAVLVLKTREWPFAPTKEIRLAPKQAHLDKRVTSAGDDIEYTNVPIIQARMFTADAQGPAKPPDKPGQGLIGRAVAGLMLNTRRMFLRDGFCRLRAGDDGNNWKLDLQHCEILDWGRPLERLTSPDAQSGVGPIAWLRRRGWIGKISG